jgi:hypothetical protein
MSIDDVTLGKIATASFLFNSLTRYNTSLATFREDAPRKLDLTLKEHRDALLNWLNAWGCRHLSRKNHLAASESILDWYQGHPSALFSDSTPIWRVTNRDLETAADAYGSLKDRLGAWRILRGDELEVPIGPTAASKILFALRPKALMPWDDAMRKAYNCDGSPESYARYQKAMRNTALHIEDLCRGKGFAIDDLPAKLDRPASTVVELLNEYIWVITRKPPIKLPSSKTLARWSSLG